MVKGIILAGSNGKLNLSKILNSPIETGKEFINDIIYRESYISNKTYKPLKKIQLNNQEKPLVHFILKTMSETNSIDEIIIVGEKQLLEENLETNEYKNAKFIQQENSILANGIKAYKHAFGSLNEGEHALFTTCDIPKVKPQHIEKFLNECEGNYDLYFLAIPWEFFKTTKQRKPLKLVDIDWADWKKFDEHGRRGFRVGNMIYANPKNIGDLNIINKAYQMRKLLNPLNVQLLKSYIGKEIKEYYQKSLTLQDVEYRISVLLKCNFKLVELPISAFEEDIDSKKDFKKFY